MVDSDRGGLNDIGHINPARIRFPASRVVADGGHQRVDLFILAQQLELALPDHGGREFHRVMLFVGAQGHEQAVAGGDEQIADTVRLEFLDYVGSTVLVNCLLYTSLLHSGHLRRELHQPLDRVARTIE